MRKEDRVERSWRHRGQMGEAQKRKLQETCEEVGQVLGWGLLLALIQFPGSRVDGNSVESEGLRSSHCMHSHTPTETSNKAISVGEGLPTH